MKTLHQAENPSIRMPAGIPGLPEPAVQSYAHLAGLLLLVHAILVALVTYLRRSWPFLESLVSGDTLRSFVTGSILMQGLLILLPTVLVLALGRIPPADLVGTRPRAGSLILAATVGIPAAVVFQGLNNLLIYILVKSGISLPSPTVSSNLIGQDLFSRSLPVIAVVITVSVIMPGIVEELMFRGVILAAFSSAGAIASAAFWQAAAFAVFHDDPLFILPPFLAGLLLANIRQRSESLLPAMLAHMSLNLSMLAITPLLPQLTAQYLISKPSQTDSLLYASLIAACVAAVAFVPLLILINHLQPNREEPERKLRFWPADWKFALAFIVLIVIMIVDNS